MSLLRMVPLAALAAMIGMAQPAPAPATLEGLNAVVWVQTSAEYRAMCLQTFAAARRSLAAALENPHWTAATEQQPPFAGLPPAIILDLDETVLDNSAFQAKLAAGGLAYSDALWQDWVRQGRALAIPGAAEFLQSAHAAGVRPFYVTNRVCGEGPEDPTRALLGRLHFPVEGATLFCKTDGSNKTARRTQVATTHRVLLLLGDDLNDFVAAARPEARESLVEAHRAKWGERWFVMPNPMYGSWERAVGTSVKEKLGVLRR